MNTKDMNYDIEYIKLANSDEIGFAKRLFMNKSKPNRRWVKHD